MIVVAMMISGEPNVHPGSVEPNAHPGNLWTRLNYMFDHCNVVLCWLLACDHLGSPCTQAHPGNSWTSLNNHKCEPQADGWQAKFQTAMPMMDGYMVAMHEVGQMKFQTRKRRW